MTIRQGCEKFSSKLKEAYAIVGIAMSKPGYTEVQSQQNMVVLDIEPLNLGTSAKTCCSFPPPPTFAPSCAYVKIKRLARETRVRNCVCVCVGACVCVLTCVFVCASFRVGLRACR